jgi:hypothetical protein
MLIVDTRTSIETLNSEIICQNYVLMIYFIRPTLISTKLQLLKIMKGSTILQVLKSFQPQHSSLLFSKVTEWTIKPKEHKEKRTYVEKTISRQSNVEKK